MTRPSARSVAKLVDELTPLSTQDAELRIATDPRFHSPEVARRLTELSVAALPERAEDSARLALTALILLDFLPSSVEIGAVAVRAHCSLGNARRLEGDLLQAETALDSAATLVTLKEDSALFLRSYALLRWEQGRCDEAIGLMIRAERLFRDSDLPEASATAQLLILFYAAMGEAADAIALFRSLGPSDPTTRPWLSARAALTAAFLLADRPDLARPDEGLASLALGDSLIPFVRDPNELLQLRWLKSRARGRMGHSEDAAAALLALRERLCPPDIRDLDFYLLTLDLIALRLAAGQGAEDLVADFGTSPVIHDLSPLTDPLRLWLAGQRSATNPWGLANSMGLFLRRYFGAYLLPIAVLPFA